MAAGSFVVVRRTISQTIVPYKDVEERLLLKRSKAKSTSLGFSSTNNVARCGVGNTPDAKKTQKTLGLERSRSEVCLRRKSSYIRETSLDVFEERQEEGLVKPVVRRREIRRVNTSRPQSDFFPEFSINNEKKPKVGGKEKAPDVEDAGKRLGRCIATLKREMVSEMTLLYIHWPSLLSKKPLMRAFLSQFSDYYFCYAGDKLMVSYHGDFRIGLTIFIADNRLFKFHLTGARLQSEREELRKIYSQFTAPHVN